MNVRTGLISNSDVRMRMCQHAWFVQVVRLVDPAVLGSVLTSLGISSFLHPVVLSEEEGIEKPDSEIFRCAFKQALDGTHLDQGVHVGDELQWYACLG